MKKFLSTILMLLSFNCLAGELLLIGGGGRPLVILQKIKELSRGKVLIVPLASSIPDEVSNSLKSDLKQVGVEAEVFACSAGKMDQPQCLKQIKTASLVFFSGGSQSKLLSAFRGTRAFNLLSERFYQNALHLAGTSAGTAIMSEVMLTGNLLPPHREMKGVRPKMMETTRGFGFVKKMILDQHFFVRHRQDRLLSAVFDRPHLVGVGIDEATAILIKSDESFEVLGESNVMIMDARKASISVDGQGTYQATGLIIKVLKPAGRFEF